MYRFSRVCPVFFLGFCKFLFDKIVYVFFELVIGEYRFIICSFGFPLGTLMPIFLSRLFSGVSHHFCRSKQRHFVSVRSADFRCCSGKAHFFCPGKIQLFIASVINTGENHILHTEIFIQSHILRLNGCVPVKIYQFFMPFPVRIFRQVTARLYFYLRFWMRFFFEQNLHAGKKTCPVNAFCTAFQGGRHIIPF